MLLGLICDTASKWQDARTLGLFFTSLRYPSSKAHAEPGGSAGTPDETGSSNRSYAAGQVEIHVDNEDAALAFDPQTSGGLLAAVAPHQVAPLLASGFSRVGEVATGSGVVLDK